MDFTDEELSALHGIVYDEAYYGDDWIVYGDSPEAQMIQRVMQIIDTEVKRRRLW
jgi:hypothetical protein